MIISTDVKKLIESFHLEANENYCLYLLRNDGWPFGYFGSYRDADYLSLLAFYSTMNPAIKGVWITKESNDGTVDIDIFKMMEGA